MQQGHVSMTDESVFEVGKNVATTEGAVVFENELFQLIEYKPLTAKVYERPFLLVPPCINKFYILDLQPENSLIRYLVAAGPPHLRRELAQSGRVAGGTRPGTTTSTTGAHQGDRGGAGDHRRPSQINALGFCVGGTMLGTALAVLAARGEKPVASRRPCSPRSSTSRDTGMLDLFIDEAFVKFREMQLGQGGLLKGQELASTFSFLRPNDLVWNYVVGNYLKGETPPPFDLLYWNSDSTNLPGPMYAWYLRNTYFENNLVKPGKCTVCGEKVDLRKVDIPVYIYGSREDHIVPIAGAYASTQHLPGKKRFVMGASGHIAGVINPPAKNKRILLDQRQAAQDRTREWLAGRDGTPRQLVDRLVRLAQAARGQADRRAQDATARAKYKAIEPAPGRYVQGKSLMRRIVRAKSAHGTATGETHGRHRHRFGRPHRRRQVRRLARQDPRHRAGRHRHQGSAGPRARSTRRRSAKSSWARCWPPASARTRRARRCSRPGCPRKCRA